MTCVHGKKFKEVDIMALTDESILDSIKKLLNVDVSDTAFDIDIKMHINTTLSILTHLGVGPDIGFSIQDNKATWKDFIPQTINLEMIKTFVYLKVKLVFDPPLNSAVIAIMKENAKELEWRINELANRQGGV